MAELAQAGLGNGPVDLGPYEVVDPADLGDEKVHLNVPRLEGGEMGLEPVDLGRCKVVDLVERVH